MNAKMQSFSATTSAPTDDLKAAEQAAVHVERVLAILAAVQSEARVLGTRLAAAGAASASAAQAVPDDITTSLQQTLGQLREMQDAVAQQQARLMALQGEDTGQSAVTPWQLREAELQQAAQDEQHAQRAGQIADSQVLQQERRGLAAVSSLQAGPAAAAGLGAEGNDQDLPHVIQVPAGEREALDGIVTLVGGMLRAGTAPIPVGKQSRLQNMAWQARPDSASLETLQTRWGSYVAAQKAPESMDVNQLIQWVMREAYVGNTEDLRAHATRVAYYTALKNQLREELSRAREFRSSHRSGVGDDAKLDAPFDKNHIVLDAEVSADGRWTVRPMQPDGTTDSLQELDAYIKALDNSLSTVGEDAQMAQLTLQNLTQQQAQAINMLSNLSKVMHDTAMSIIRKVGS